jgi:hypothetical protein
MRKVLTITMDPDVIEALESDAKRMGLTKSGYLSQLVMQKNIEINAMRVVGSMTNKQLREQIAIKLGE